MAKPVENFPGQNAILGPPPGEEENVTSLPIMLANDPRGIQTVTSCWQLSPEEIEAMKLKGGKIYFTVWGHTHPPIFVSPIHPLGLDE